MVKTGVLGQEMAVPLSLCPHPPRMGYEMDVKKTEKKFVFYLVISGFFCNFATAFERKTAPELLTFKFNIYV